MLDLFMFLYVIYVFSVSWKIFFEFIYFLEILVKFVEKLGILWIRSFMGALA